MEYLSLLAVKIKYSDSSKLILIGKLGERYAVLKLKELGFIIWDENYSSKIGEIDIVASKRRTLYLVEVKTRKIKHIDSFSLKKQVNDKKIRKLSALLKLYKTQNISELKKRRIINYDIKFFGTAYSWKDKILPKFHYWELSEL